MPVYDYLCTTCDHRADILHGINDPGPRYCPSCGAEGTMRKQFAAPAIHFKGSGWAKKDRGGSGASTRASAKSAAAESDRGARPAGEGGSSSASSGPTSDTSSATTDTSKPTTSTD